MWKAPLEYSLALVLAVILFLTWLLKNAQLERAETRSFHVKGTAGWRIRVKLAVLWTGVA